MSTESKRRVLKPDELHLLRIIRDEAKDDTDLRFELEWYTRTGSPRYMAVSYTWGSDATSGRTISINGQLQSVTNNLWWCLYYTVHTTAWQHVWVDALCINQTDSPEKSGQVREMAATYRDAHLVTAWLGNEDEDDDRENEDRWDSAWRYEHALSHGWKWEIALLRLARRKYWSRRWIIQELFHARRVEVVCGPHRLQWSEFETLLEQSQYPMDALSGPWTVREVLRSQNRRLHPVETLVSLSDLDCKDPRDRVFALLSLFPPEYRKALEPDYAKSTKELFRNFIGVVFQKDDHDAIGSHAENFAHAMAPQWGVLWCRLQMIHAILTQQESVRARDYAWVFLSRNSPEEWFKTPMHRHELAYGENVTARTIALRKLDCAMNELLCVIVWLNKLGQDERVEDLEAMLAGLKQYKPEFEDSGGGLARHAAGSEIPADNVYPRLISMGLSFALKLTDRPDGVRGDVPWRMEWNQLRRFRTVFCREYGLDEAEDVLPRETLDAKALEDVFEALQDVSEATKDTATLDNKILEDYFESLDNSSYEGTNETRL